MEFEVGGYVRIRAYSREFDRDCYVCLYRLTAWAHDEIVDAKRFGDEPVAAGESGEESADSASAERGGCT